MSSTSPKATTISLAAVAREISIVRNLRGVLFAALAVASAIGRLLYGSMASRDLEDRRLANFLGVFIPGLGPMQFCSMAAPRRCGRS